MLASFPGRSHCQYLITCSMQARWGDRHFVMCNNVRVDTQRAVPNRNNACFTLICPRRCKQRTVSIARLAYALTSSFLTDSTRKGRRFFTGHCPPCVYLMAPHETRSPSPPPTVFAYCKRLNTGGGNGLGMRLHLCSTITNATIHSRYSNYLIEMSGNEHCLSGNYTRQLHKLHEYCCLGELLECQLCSLGYHPQRPAIWPSCLIGPRASTNLQKLPIFC